MVPIVSQGKASKRLNWFKGVGAARIIVSVKNVGVIGWPKAAEAPQ